MEHEFWLADPASAPARAAMTRYFEELGRRFTFGIDVPAALDGAAATFRAPHGAFVLAGTSDAPLACGAVRFLDETRAEIKRMWVAPSARTSGVGGRLVEYLEDLARGSGRGTMVLDTNSALREAVALYERHGYKRTRPYNDNPDADLWFEKKLTEAKAASGPGGHRRDLHVDARD